MYKIHERCIGFATRLLKSLPEGYHYHDIKHTMEVFRASMSYGRSEGLKQKDLILLGIAALFHDTGYISLYEKNEPVGADIARKYLLREGFGKRDITKVSSLIMATEMPQMPKNLMQKIICDSDLDSLGRKDFFKRGNLLKKELEEVKSIRYTKQEWYTIQRNLVMKHRYFTKSAQMQRARQQRRNLEMLEFFLSRTRAERTL